MNVLFLDELKIQAMISPNYYHTHTHTCFMSNLTLTINHLPISRIIYFHSYDFKKSYSKRIEGLLGGWYLYVHYKNKNN